MLSVKQKYAPRIIITHYKNALKLNVQSIKSPLCEDQILGGFPMELVLGP